MGWKASCILVNERGAGYLGTLPDYDPLLARSLLRRLGHAGWRDTSVTTLEHAICPARLAMGAYGGAAIMADPAILAHASSLPDLPLLRRVVGMFPDAAIMALALDDAVGLFAYCLYERGKLARFYAGDVKRGIIAEQGEVQPEERPSFEHSVMHGGERFFEKRMGGALEEFPAVVYGEQLAFALSARFFGRPLNESGADWRGLEMEEFAPPSLWQRLLHR